MKYTSVIGSAAVFAAAALGALALYQRVFALQPHVEIPPPWEGYDGAAIQQAIDPSNVREEQEKIIALGSRFMGQPGVYAAESHIRRAFAEAGLEVFEQDNLSVAPKTVFREITDAGGVPLPGVEIFPFMPNHLQPMATPEDGLEGRLVILNDESLTSLKSFKDCIGLLEGNIEKVSLERGYYWSKYAQLGIKAIIVAHRDGLAGIEWEKVARRDGGIVASVPINFVRVAATQEIFNHVGQTIRLRVKTVFANTPNTTIIGLMRAGNPVNEALVVTAHHDAFSVLPDLAPGALQAIGPAALLALVKGMAPYRESMRRDVIFVSFGARMMACDGLNSLIRVLGDNPTGASENALVKALGLGGDTVQTSGETRTKARAEARLAPILKRKEENDAGLKTVESMLKTLSNPAFLSDPVATKSSLKNLSKEENEFLLEQFRYVLNTRVFDLSEKTLQAKLRFERDETQDISGEPFLAYRAAKTEYDEALSAAGFSIVNLLKTKQKYVKEHDVRGRCEGRFNELLEHHLRKQDQLAQDLKIAELFNRYDDISVVEPLLTPAYDERSQKEVLSFKVGMLQTSQLPTPPRAAVFMSLLAAAKQRLNLGKNLAIPPLAPRQDVMVGPHVDNQLPKLSAEMWRYYKYSAFTMVNLNRTESYSRHCFPVEFPFMRDIESLRHTLRLLGETVLSLAHGNGRFPPPSRQQPLHLGGQVLVSNVGRSIVPNYPLKNAVLACRPQPDNPFYSWPGYYQYPLYMTDAYGKYDLPNQASDFVPIGQYKNYSPLAAGYGDDGVIAYFKDEGEEGQRLYKSVGINSRDRKKAPKINIVVFRASPVSVLDLINPQTLGSYTGVELVTRSGLSAFRKKCEIRFKDLYTIFIEPDARFFAKLLAGSPENELAKMPRAFLLGINDAYELDPDKEIDGEGYLAYDTPLLLDIPMETARSMIHVNAKRLELQNRYHMTDERMREFQEKSEKLSEGSENEEMPYKASTLTARDAVTYSTLNHPVIRESVFEAIVGILWYLGLLVPFVIFFEKLVFGFTDIRKQLLVQGITFIVVFSLLKYLHPAFEMIRSSLMILLGFIIILISGGITVLFLSKFQRNLDHLKRLQGKVRGAEVNTLGVTAVAFKLGLNNMHRRKLRTGLTCLTLTVMTFLMICFTSVDSDLVDTATAIGKAPYQGILFKLEQFRPISALPALQDKYSDRFDVCQRKIMLGREWKGSLRNSALEAVYEKDGLAKNYDFVSILSLSENEPLRDKIKLLTEPAWFTEENMTESEKPLPVFIPDKMAEFLGIYPSAVDREDIEIRINGRACLVKGIFDSLALEQLRDLDGTSLLPFDLEAMTSFELQGNMVLADPDDPRLPAGQIVICPARDLGILADNAEGARLVSVAIHMPDLGYKDAKEEIDMFLEQNGRATYYGLDGVAYLGKRARERSVAGLIELLIPLLIAALTVLNTMKGSVYERTDEIFVYNAVGIAPRYVFFMFFAEAFVYAVVGSVLGYLLSQGSGRILTALDMTGGLNMTYASITTIYASLSIAAAVFISTYFPAKSAMEIATPAEDAGWGLPEPDGDDLNFDLPFSCDKHDRVAIMSFFDRYLRDHGEGSAGRFFAGLPSAGVSSGTAGSDTGGYIPQISSAIWLKPFDLGVSQEMTISMPFDTETGEYKARIQLRRLSGKRDSWLRLNYSFVSLIRRHFLHWRAVRTPEREEMFREARKLLIENCGAQ